MESSAKTTPPGNRSLTESNYWLVDVIQSRCELDALRVLPEGPAPPELLWGAELMDGLAATQWLMLKAVSRKGGGGGGLLQVYTVGAGLFV